MDRDTRREENQKMFRHGNESLRDAAVNAEETSPVPFLCECAEVNCLGRVNVTTAQWENVAKDATTTS